MTKHFASQLLSQYRLPVGKCEKNSVFGVFNKNIGYSTEFQALNQLKKQFMTWYSLLIYSPKIDNKYPSEMRN